MKAADKEKAIATILDAIAKGRSLRSVCDEVGIPPSTFCDWKDADGRLAEHYARARELQAEHYADEIIRIADTSEDPQKARLQVDARKWIASKLLPKKYGDKVDLTTNGKDLIPPPINLNR